MKFSPEQLVQLSCVDFTHRVCMGVLISASQNGLYLGGARNVAAYIQKQKILGMLPGELDLMLTWAGKNILYAEIKSEDGRVSPNQHKVMDIRRGQGFDCCVAYSLDEYVGYLRSYKVPMRNVYYAGIGRTLAVAPSPDLDSLSRLPVR